MFPFACATRAAEKERLFERFAVPDVHLFVVLSCRVGRLCVFGCKFSKLFSGIAHSKSCLVLYATETTTMTNDKVLTGDTMAVATAIKLENQEQAFVQAEEKLMDEDEEVTSVESGNVEDAMVNIALVQSVVESGDADLKERLRKRPRPSGRDLERLEHLQSSGKGGMAHSSDPLAVPNPLLNPIPKQTPSNVKIEPPEAATVPSPLPAISSEVTQESRGEPISESKRRVNFEDPPVTRLRGFSIDLDCKYR